MIQNYKKVIKYFYLSIILAVIFIGYTINIGFHRSSTMLVMLDIGQGDSIFIHTDSGHNILIDGGPDSSVVYQLSQQLPFYDRTIDLIILTHSDADHLNGLIEIAKRYDVKNVLFLNKNEFNPAFTEFKEIVQEKNINTLHPFEISKILISDVYSIDVLHPKQENSFSLNDNSIVVKFNYWSNCALLTGDISQKIERPLAQEQNINCSLLKAGHHGSKTSNSQEFLKAVNPDMFLISAGKDNKFKHPNQEVIDRLESLGIKYLNTATQGEIEVILSPGEPEISVRGKGLEQK